MGRKVIGRKKAVLDKSETDAVKSDETELSAKASKGESAVDALGGGLSLFSLADKYEGYVTVVCEASPSTELPVKLPAATLCKVSPMFARMLSSEKKGTEEDDNVNSFSLESFTYENFNVFLTQAFLAQMEFEYFPPKNEWKNLLLLAQDFERNDMVGLLLEEFQREPTLDGAVALVEANVEVDWSDNIITALAKEATCTTPCTDETSQESTYRYQCNYCKALHKTQNKTCCGYTPVVRTIPPKYNQRLSIKESCRDQLCQLPSRVLLKITDYLVSNSITK